MKNFFTIKRIAYLTILAVLLITMIILLAVPIGSLGSQCLVFYTQRHEFITITNEMPIWHFQHPFTYGADETICIRVWQTVVFTLVVAVFVVFTTLFAVELKRAGVFVRRPTKAERFEAKIDELQKQVDKLKKGE